MKIKDSAKYNNGELTVGILTTILSRTSIFICTTKQLEPVAFEQKNYNFPIPGIEPEPPGWKPGILATRPYGIW